MTLPVAVDAMGGDHGPDVVVAGALAAAADGIPVVLVGRSEEIRAAGGGSLPVIEADDVISMADEPGRAVRAKRDSSIVRAVGAVRDHVACAAVSAGNTGAVVAAALLRLRRLPGVARPAIATVLPVPDRRMKVLVDSGAMADCSADWLWQFARMGSTYARLRFGIERPRVGLLSIGEEPGKGNALTKQTHGLLAADDGIDFYGNVEGSDVLDGSADVIVTDGFTGNVLLKALEGTASYFIRLVLDRLMSGGDEAAAALELLAPLAHGASPERVGGAMLLGVRGVTVIAHGSSSATAIRNAVKVGFDMAQADLAGELSASVYRAADRPADADADEASAPAVRPA